MSMFRHARSGLIALLLVAPLSASAETFEILDATTPITVGTFAGPFSRPTGSIGLLITCDTTAITETTNGWDITFQNRHRQGDKWTSNCGIAANNTGTAVHRDFYGTIDSGTVAPSGIDMQECIMNDEIRMSFNLNTGTTSVTMYCEGTWIFH